MLDVGQTVLLQSHCPLNIGLEQPDFFTLRKKTPHVHLAFPFIIYIFLFVRVDLSVDPDILIS